MNTTVLPATDHTLTAKPDKWLMFRKPRPQAAVRLLCFHHAGGAALAYRNWVDRMPAFIDVCPVQLPGRGNRFGEAPFRAVGALVDTLLESIAPLLDRPVALFGHSMGAALAFATATELEQQGRQVVHLFASGRRAPLSAFTTALHRLGDAALEIYLRDLRGTPQIVFEDAELKATVFELLRADLALNDSYVAGEPLARVPISALGGNSDHHVPLPALDAWQGLTKAGFTRYLLKAGTFLCAIAKLPSSSMWQPRWQPPWSANGDATALG
ncbi:thioesterase II family protein [Chitinimonas sp. BJB300]|uniref:thioesterase II family protein n=2 Tax=Chitinimonas sp. BJB300 TaxID=1559339 RepID=UPI0011124B30|nr:alpha/beta fold hydrolase [Chitinimonas sp. BJB300]TSJ87508.1 thioesterase [Chitinimonas sp. BJB300]